MMRKEKRKSSKFNPIRNLLSFSAVFFLIEFFCFFSWIDVSTNLPMMAASFDQECASVSMARIAVHRADCEEGADVLRWVDKMLIRLVCVQCDVFIRRRTTKRNIFSFSISISVKNLVSLKKIILDHFNLRIHLHFIHNSCTTFDVHNFCKCLIIVPMKRRSTGETIESSRSTFFLFFFLSFCFRHYLLVEDLTQCLVMIQPILYAYSFNGPPEVKIISSLFHRLIFDSLIV